MAVVLAGGVFLWMDCLLCLPAVDCRRNSRRNAATAVPSGATQAQLAALRPRLNQQWAPAWVLALVGKAWAGRRDPSPPSPILCSALCQLHVNFILSLTFSMDATVCTLQKVPSTVLSGQHRIWRWRGWGGGWEGDGGGGGVAYE